jgi:hypothetical protein
MKNVKWKMENDPPFALCPSPFARVSPFNGK